MNISGRLEELRERSRKDKRERTARRRGCRKGIKHEEMEIRMKSGRERRY